MAMRFLRAVALCGLLLSYSVYAQPNANAGDTPPDNDSLALAVESLIFENYVDSVLASLRYEKGTLTLGEGMATLQVPTGFHYLNPEDAATVLTNIWGNPPSETLGLLFPVEYPLDDSTGWAINIQFEETGYVDDEDAAGIDYNELLEAMQEDVRANNAARAEMGYPAVHLLDWAARPRYDAAAKKLYWARELHFESNYSNVLNYNIRILGRKGVLVMNAIGPMNKLGEIEQRTPAVLASVDFNAGHRYSDYEPGIDKVAAYGVGGLIAGKVLMKTGFLALLAKGWKLIVAGLILIGALVRKFLFGKKDTAASETETA